MDEHVALILYRLDEQGRKLDAIDAKVSLTNGRVGKLELWRASVDGARHARSWVGTLTLALIPAVVAAVLTAALV